MEIMGNLITQVCRQCGTEMFRLWFDKQHEEYVVKCVRGHEAKRFFILTPQ